MQRLLGFADANGSIATVDRSNQYLGLPNVLYSHRDAHCFSHLFIYELLP
jgi:hypothetical protein